MAKKEKNQNKKSKKWLITGFVILGIGLAATGVTYGMGILTIARDLIPLTAGFSIGVPVGGVVVEKIVNKNKTTEATTSNTQNRTLDRELEESLEPIPVEAQEQTVEAIPVSTNNVKKNKSQKR